MKVTKEHINFAIVWIKRLLLKKDFELLEKYIEGFNKKLENYLYPVYPTRVWNELLHYFFMMELGACLKSEHVIVDNNNAVVRLLSTYDELCMWQRRLKCSDNIGTLEILPFDVLYIISDMLAT